MRRPIDSLFGRLVVLVIGVLVLSHVAWFAVIRVERDQSQTRYAVEEATFLVDAVRQHIATSPDQPLPSSVRIVDPASHDVPKPLTDADVETGKLPPSFAGFLDDLRDRLPDGTDVRVGDPGGPPSLWVRGVRDANWIVVPVQPLRPPRSRDRMLVWLAIIFSTAVMAAGVSAVANPRRPCPSAGRANCGSLRMASTRWCARYRRTKMTAP
jgi:two-component system osmolarity sensor histidine kinase EnvZ